MRREGSRKNPGARNIAGCDERRMERTVEEKEEGRKLELHSERASVATLIKAVSSRERGAPIVQISTSIGWCAAQPQR